MLTEFHGDPVAGGTYPALIWKTFMEQALPYLEDGRAESFPPPPTRTRRPSRGRATATGGSSSTTATAAPPITSFFFSGEQPRQTANCKPNEVEVPELIGDARSARPASSSSASRSHPRYIFKPAHGAAAGRRRRRPGPEARGRLSAYDEVKLVLPKPTHGVVPRSRRAQVGEPAQAQARAAQAAATRSREVDKGKPGRVVFQVPQAGVAAAPGMLDQGSRSYA